MTAHDLIDSIFQRGLMDQSGNQRSITREQLDYLYDLIARDPEGRSVRRGIGKSLIWTPAGDWKYVITEDRIDKKHTLTRLGNLQAGYAGSLFGNCDRSEL